MIGACARLILTSMLMIATVPVSAQAQSFDLECARLDENSEPMFTPQTVHYQVDRKSGRWCDGTCGKVESIARQEGTTITLVDRLYYGDPKMIEYHEDTGLLVDGFALGTEFERITNYSCTKDAFGNFDAYLAQPVRQKGSFRVSNADLFDDLGNPGPSGWVGFEVTADPIGSLLSCEIILSSGNPQLDTRTCALVMERLRVLPALDRVGHPIEGKLRNRIRWYGDDD